jgi:hypothetical protein
MKKKKIMEIVDSNEVIIGSDDKPQVDPNAVTQSSQMTDRNANMAHQQYNDNFWGTFGFSLYENDEKKPLVDKLAELMFLRFQEWVSALDGAEDGVANEFAKWKKTASKSFSELKDEDKKSDYKWANRIMEILKNKESKKDNKILSNDEMKKIAEDVITKNRNNDKLINKDKIKNTDILQKKATKINDIVKDLSKTQKGDLVKKLFK